jgi:Protein of unknown function (DUF2934)
MMLQHGSFQMQNLEQAIRERAYHLWMAAGCHEGSADAYWLSAQREILTASVSTDAEISPAKADAPVVKKKPATKAKAATTVTKVAAKPAKAKRQAA